ncbi:MAG TPA: DUF3127 domain-containing protein, partial [Brumimicrobium sp.]|nr:DUF3127 domain-containing protein [Brumimicrobium sp.]
VTDTFKKREFVITDNSSSYPQDILFQLTQDRTGLIDDVKVNDIINVSFNIRGREWTSPQGEVRYFNSLDAWRVDKNQGAAPTPTNIPPASAESAETLIDESDDDLPF